MTQCENQRYRLNAPDITAETIDGEVIALNLQNGLYYSMQGWASWIWQQLENHQNAQSIVAHLQNHLPPSAISDQLPKQISGFIADLLTATIIVADDGEASAAIDVDFPADTYQAPTLSTFGDMQDLLTIDPIHGSDETGWPLAQE